ncbi:WD40 repeat domain-containing protein [Streptomyces sp. NPDC057424]|uniref:WD40 repeat domain-containing protein n=1 Tax=Streptomyces sp. NPDC057424 TaxID=3346127 RepID=UPI00367FF833
MIISASFSTADDNLIVALSDGDILGWDVVNLEIVQRFNLDAQNRRTGSIAHFAFSENGRRFVCARITGPLTVWNRDEKSGEYTLSDTLRAPKVELMSISDNGTIVWGAAGSGIHLKRPGADAIHLPVDLFLTEGARNKLTALAVSPDAQMLAYATGDRVIVASVGDVVMNPATFTPIFDSPCRAGQVNALKFHQGAKFLACAGWRGVEILDFRNHQRTAQIVLGEGHTRAIAFSLEGHVACVGSSGVSVFSLRDRRSIYRKDVSDVSSVAFSLDSSVLAVTRRREVELWS